MAELGEMVQFLQPESRFDLKRFATTTVAQLTGTEQGIELLCKDQNLLKSLFKMIKEQEVNTARDAFKTIINISAEESGSLAFINLDNFNVAAEIIDCIKDPQFLHANYSCGVLANLTRNPCHCQMIVEQIEKSSHSIEDLVAIFCQIEYNKRKQNLHLLAPFFTNLSQIPQGRRILLNKEKGIIEKLISFIDNNESKGRRKSVIGTIHNCCFDKEYHPYLLGEMVDLATRLVFPLAGPDTFTAEENESLPLDLQFLEDSKTREEDPEIRKLLLEALMQFCQTKASRETLRDMNIYLILREHHKWETDKYCTMLNEDIVNLIVRTEEEIGADDISALSVPEDLVPKFQKMDETYLAEEMAQDEELNKGER